MNRRQTWHSQYAAASGFTVLGKAFPGDDPLQTGGPHARLLPLLSPNAHFALLFIHVHFYKSPMSLSINHARNIDFYAPRETG